MRRALPWIYGVVGVALVIGIWELYKLIGPEDGFTIFSDGSRGSGILILPRNTARAMPHIWDMLARMAEPVAGGDSMPMWQAVLLASLTTLGISALGLAIGLVVGFLFALLMLAWRPIEWGVLPWIIVSQTVPLVAFAPLLASIGNRVEQGGGWWPLWLTAAIVASYLAFFPIAVGALRGLQAPDRIHRELMTTYAAGPTATLFKLRLPASVPYLLPSLRLAAANAVIGAIVAEVSINQGGGIGRMVYQLSGQSSADPAAPWDPLFGAIAVGLVAAGSVGLLGLILRNYRRGEATA